MLKRRNDMKKHLIHSCVSVVRPSGESNNTTYDTTLPVAMKVEMKKAEDGNHECDCRISLTPDADTDDRSRPVCGSRSRCPAMAPL
ncbi:unnamed protein product [Staurois parvus]|uniref:Uncharacterized protein n=1 Tax=Staurois parvus TaxID=386267 RepID=A0ABN9H461_9NEOB|nr:unnamed protein product [Staurois parvus]